MYTFLYTFFGMTVRFIDQQEVTDDLNRLPSRRLREVAIGWMRRLARDPELGESCGWSSSTGDLSDCCKLYFDYDDDPRVVTLETRRKPRYYRIVYRPLDDGVEIIAVGPGHPPPSEDAVYVVAGRRLGRLGRMVRPRGDRRRVDSRPAPTIDHPLTAVRCWTTTHPRLVHVP